nr:hypothetical protein [Tanacetum cinerariifolium]
MLVPQQAAADVDDAVNDDVAVDDVSVADAEPTPSVENLEQDKIAQSLEIIQLKKRFRKLEKKKKFNVFGLKRLQKDVIMEEVNAEEDTKVVEKNVDVQGRPEESQPKVYHIDLKHADKVLSMQDDVEEPAELQEVIEVVTTAKLMTEVVTAANATITAAPSAARRRKEVVIRDPEETATPSTIIEQDEAYARELEAELNKNINSDDVIEQIKENGKLDNDVLRYQPLKRKPQIEAQARKNMMVYLKNMAGFKMDYFKGMSYDDILGRRSKQALKRTSGSQEEKAVKKQKLDEEVEELKKHLQIVPNDDDVYTEATPLALKVPIEDYEIYLENNKLFYKIIRADGSHQLFLSFLSLLRNFDREDLEML